MAKLKKLWAFGDSFTYSFELNKNHPYYKFKTDDGKTYVEWLAQEYDAELWNMGTPGWGNTHILHDLLYYSPQFSDEDIIIVGTSDSTRVQSFEYHEYRNLFYQASYSWYIDEFDTNNSKKHIGEEFPDSLKNYVVNCKQPVQGYHNFYDISMILNVLKICKGQKKALWTVAQWGKFETINEHTKGEIPDMHWSWNGHKDFFTYLKNQLNITDFFVDTYLEEMHDTSKYGLDPLDNERKLPILLI